MAPALASWRHMMPEAGVGAPCGDGCPTLTSWFRTHTCGTPTFLHSSRPLYRLLSALPRKAREPRRWLRGILECVKTPPGQ